MSESEKPRIFNAYGVFRFCFSLGETPPYPGKFRSVGVQKGVRGDAIPPDRQAEIPFAADRFSAPPASCFFAFFQTFF
jgi:hypothetical protein